MKKYLALLQAFLTITMLTSCIRTVKEEPKTVVCERCFYTYDVLKNITDDPFRRSKYIDTVQVLEILEGFVLYVDYPYYEIKRSESIEYFQSKTTLISQEKITRDNIKKFRNY